MHFLSVSIALDFFMAQKFLSSGKIMSNSSPLSSFSKLFFLYYQLKSLKPWQPFLPRTEANIGQSATTSRAGGMEDGPWKGQGPPLLVAADF